MNNDASKADNDINNLNDVSDDVSNATSDDVSDDVSNTTSDDVSDDVSDDTSDLLSIVPQSYDYSRALNSNRFVHRRNRFNCFSSINSRLRAFVRSPRIYFVIGTVLSIIVSTILFLNSNFLADHVAKSYVPSLKPMGNVEKIDNRLGVKIDSKETFLELGDSDLSSFNKDLRVYYSSGGEVNRSSVHDLLIASENNSLLGYLDEDKSIIVFECDKGNVGGTEGSIVIDNGSASCRYFEVDEVYVLDVYNPRYKEYANKKSFNGKSLIIEPNGELSVRVCDGESPYIVLDKECCQIAIPKDYDVEKIVDGIVNWLDGGEL